jgi:hypothetical protein
MSEPAETPGAEAPADEAEPATEPAGPPTLHGVLLTDSRGQRVLHPGRDELVDLVRRLRDDEGFRVCIDLTAVDYVA